MAADNRADKMSEDKPTLYAIENAFQPAKEISDVDRFAGRAKPVAEAFLGLMAEGANIAIVGNRGIENLHWLGRCRILVEAITAFLRS